MNHYPTEEANLGSLVKQSFRLHFLTLKKTIFFILSLLFIKYMVAIAGLFFTSSVSRAVFSAIGLLIAVFPFSASLYAAHESILDHNKTFSDSITVTRKNLLTIYGAVLSYIGIIVIAYLTAKFLGFVTYKLITDFRSPVHGVRTIISATILLMAVAIFFFTYPLAVIEPKKITSTLYNSLILSDKSKFGIFVLLFILMAINVLISQASLEQQFFSAYHLGFLYDFTVFCVMLPLFINLLLLVIHDAKLQLTAEGEVVS